MKRQFGPVKAERGIAMVEFAIALPLLLLLLLAVAEFGRMLYHYNNLMQASRDASRFVAGQAWNTTLGKIELSDALKAAAQNIAVFGLPVDLDMATVTATPVVPGLTPGHVSVDSVGAEHIQVRISYEFQPVIGDSIPGFIGERIPLRVPLVATTVMRAL